MKSIFTCVLVFFSVMIFGQTNFKRDWPGNWAGQLDIINTRGKVQSIPMELLISLIDSSGTYSWTIIYGEDREAGKRAYELRTVNEEKGYYLLDEKNSIQMEAYLVGGKLYQWYEVAGNLITSSSWLEGEELIWELVSGSSEPASITGGQEADGEQIPSVKAFPVKVVQRARLKKQ